MSTPTKTAPSKGKTAVPAQPKSAPASKAKTAAPVEEPKPLTRPLLIEALHNAGYPADAPTSFTATTLRLALNWLQAGAPATDTSLPSGIRFAVHPDLRPTRSSKETAAKRSKGYAQATADVMALLDQGATLADVRAWATPTPTA